MIPCTTMNMVMVKFMSWRETWRSAPMYPSAGKYVKALKGEKKAARAQREMMLHICEGWKTV
jgi:hypothetical protein